MLSHLGVYYIGRPIAITFRNLLHLGLLQGLSIQGRQNMSCERNIARHAIDLNALRHPEGPDGGDQHGLVRSQKSSSISTKWRAIVDALCPQWDSED